MNPDIAFIGNCQVFGLGDAARRLLPDSQVSSFQVGTPHNSDEIVAQVTGSDVVITQIRDESRHGPALGPAALARPGRTVIYLPSFVFTGFHPDMMYLAIDRVAEPGPISSYHSLLAAAAFVAGIPKRHAPRLYNAHVFARLGYLDAFAAARVAVTEAFAEEGYDLGPAFVAWLTADRPFMLTMNHPAIPVLSWLAMLALQRAGLVDADPEPPRDLHDWLADSVVMPVFPAIARRAGVAGSTTYLRPIVPESAPEEREMPLADYVAQSYEIYQRLDRSALMTRRIRAAAAAVQAAVAAGRYPAPVRSLASSLAA